MSACTRPEAECPECRGTRTVLVTVYSVDGESDYEAPCTRCVEGLDTYATMGLRKPARLPIIKAKGQNA